LSKNQISNDNENMITYIEFTDYSLLLSFIYQKLGSKNKFENVLETGKIDNVQKIKLQNVGEIEQYLSSGDGLFEDQSEQANNLLIDIQDIDINKQKLENYDGQVFLYSSELDSLNAETKKNLKKYKIEVELLKKIDTNIGSQLYNEYCNKIDLKITSSQIDTLVAQTISYHEIIDNLDFISMSGDDKKGYEALLKAQKPALFMQGFNLANLDTMPWYKNVDENELQLALSLIFGKLDKISSNKAKSLQQQIIYTDQKIKTSSKLPALTWFRLLLWKAKAL
jgi:hypothetical protein